MKVVDLLESRRQNWRELEQLCNTMELQSKKKAGPATVTEFATLYRAACADLALADAYQLPHNTIQYLHQLVGRAHNQLYRSQSFNFAAWGRILLFDVPQQLFHDNCLRLAFCVFWGIFIAAMCTAYVSPKFAESVVGREQLDQAEEMYKLPLQGRDPNERALMHGFYVRNNAGIGLQCFAAGIVLLGAGGLFITVSNAAQLGVVFGYMATTDSRENFFKFVTAHGPFELTAIVLAAAAGMRLGFALIDARGWARLASLRRAGKESVPIVCASVLLFCMAALIEAYVSPSALPYPAKAAVAIVSCGMLMFYFVLLGYPRGD